MRKTNNHKFAFQVIPEGVKHIDQFCLKCGIKSRKYKSSRTYQYEDGTYSDYVPICNSKNKNKL